MEENKKPENVKIVNITKDKDGVFGLGDDSLVYVYALGSWIKF